MSGGAERVIAQLVGFFTKQGIQVSVILVDKRPIHYILPDNCKITEIGPQSESALQDKVARYRKVRKLVLEEKPDLVLSMPEEIGIYVLVALVGTGIPVVVSERNNPWVMPDRKITRMLRRLMYPHAAGLVFQTEKAASFFSADLQKKGQVIPNPLDSSRLPVLYTGLREKVVISAGRLDTQKNFPLLIDGFAKFSQTHSDYKLVIYGEGPKAAQLQEYAAQKLPENTYSFPGRVDDLPERFGRSAIFALSSDFEGVPNVLIEAMAMGTPCVSTDCAPGGAASLIDSGKNGILVPVGDVQALADSLCFMADHPEEAMAMANEATKVRQTLDSERISAKWLAYLEKCVQK